VSQGKRNPEWEQFVRIYNRTVGTAILLVLLVSTGCGDGSGLVSASGTVTLDGQPLSGVVVEFRPSTAGGPSFFGRTDSSGRYRMMRTAFQSGVAPGEYFVLIYYESTDDPSCSCETEQERREIPARYRFPAELQVTVEARGRNRFDFELMSP
jgi:hypothetical protein